MFPPGSFGVGVTVAALRPAEPHDVTLPEGVVSRPSRLGELLPVEEMTPDQKAASVFAMEHDQRLDWHFIPKERKGITLKEMTPQQHPGNHGRGSVPPAEASRVCLGARLRATGTPRRALRRW